MEGECKAKASGNDEDGLIFGLFIFALIVVASAAVGGMLGYGYGTHAGREQQRKVAASHGLGSYQFNKRTGEADFHYGVSGPTGKGWVTLYEPE